MQSLPALQVLNKRGGGGKGKGKKSKADLDDTILENIFLSTTISTNYALLKDFVILTNS